MQSFKTYHRLREYGETNEIRGEYWIESDGDIHFADGDIGDLNHEGMVIQRLQNGISEKLHWKYADNGDWEEFKKDAAQETYDKLKETATTPEQHTELDEHWEEDPEYFLDLWRKENDVSQDDWDMAEGRGDARDYAMEHWGWKRVQGNNVETYNFTSEDRSTIAAGLESILDEEGIEEDMDEEMEFYIYVTTGGSHSMTLAQLKEGEKAIQPPEHQGWFPTQRSNPVPAEVPPFNPVPDHQPLAHPAEIPILHVNPLGPRPNPFMDMKSKAAAAASHNQDKEIMHPYYKGKIGDAHDPSASFKAWLVLNETARDRSIGRGR